MSKKKTNPPAAQASSTQTSAAKKPVKRPTSRNKIDKDVSGHYNRMVQSLLDIWNVLANASEPLTAKQVGDLLKAWKKDTSPQTAERRLFDAVDLINTTFPQTVLHEEGKPPILHTYPHNGSLHVVVEDTFGKPLWSGDMTAVFHESAVNSIPHQPTLNRKLPEMTKDFDDMKLAVKKNKQNADSTQKAAKGSDAQEDILFEEGYPPLSLAAIVEAMDKNNKKVVLSSVDYDFWQKSLPPKDQNAKSPTRKFYLKSILSPEEWQMLSDMILVYPYISEMETDKLISAMRRMAPGSRKWHKLVHAKKTPNAVRFDFIRILEEAIQNRNKVSIQYGRYQLAYDMTGWNPKLLPDGNGPYITAPYALTWSNGYYYLVGSIQKKDANGQVTQEMRNFRLDRIKEIISSTMPFDKPADFDVYQYRDRSPVMYPGETRTIKLRCHTSLLSVLMDFFGTAISGYTDPLDANGKPITDVNQDVAYATVTFEASENGTKLFALQYAERVEVLEPQSLRDEVAATLKACAAKYQ